jgi:hypothetical protein
MLPSPGQPPSTSLYKTVPLPEICEPVVAVLLHKMQLVSVGLLEWLAMPPPSYLAEFPLNVQLVTIMLA